MSDASKARAEQIYQQPFSPSPVPLGTEHRVASALEYIAYQLGEIRRGIDEINERERATVSRR